MAGRSPPLGARGALAAPRRGHARLARSRDGPALTSERAPRHPSPVAAAFIGAAGGVAAGLLGIGGGLVMVPLMTLGLDVPIKRAVGTSLLGVLVTSAVGVAAESVVAPRNIHWAAAAALGAGSVAGAWIGARVLARTTPIVLARLMAGLLVVAAVRMTGVVGWLLAGGAPVAASEPLAIPVTRVLAHSLVGLGAGIVATMFGVGGGILAVPALTMLHPGWTFQACRATSLAMIVPTSIVGAVLLHRLEHVDLTLARALVPGAVVACIVGVLLANSVPGRPLQLLFALVLLACAAQLARRRPRPAAADSGDSVR